MTEQSAAAEPQLRRSEERYRSLVEAMAAIVWSTPADGRFETGQPGWSAFTGQSFEELRGWGWLDAVHPEDRDATVLAWSRATASRELYEIEHRVRRHDGPYRHMAARAVPLLDKSGALREWAGLHVDIHDRKEADRALREAYDLAEQRAAELDAVFESMADAVYIGTEEGITKCNAHALRQLGASSLRDLRRRIGELGAQFNVRYPDGRPVPPGELSFARALRGEVAVEDVIARNAETGRDVHIRGASSPVVLNGQVIGAVAINTDISDRVRAEEERRQLLESERAARGEAERASRIKDEFVATLSHELRTPLHAILGWTEILKGRKDDPRTLEQGLQVIERNARAQAQMVADLLDMSSIISGKIRLDVQPVDLASVVDNAAEAVRLAAEAKGIRIVKAIDRRDGVIHGDPARLQQILWNLLSNAIKFTPPGGTVRIDMESSDSRVEIRVSDTGQGFDPAFAPYLFERFRQVDASTTRQFGGLGLGLAIVKQLVEIHGGTVEAASPGPGQGATFSITLPTTLRVPPAETAAPDGRPEVLSLEAGSDGRTLAGVRVLVVDDHPDARDLVRRVLEERKAEVTTVSSAAEALAALRLSPPDVLVSDLGMPDEDGYSLIRAVRALPP
ncbi:MAG TPA: ATP-binding protein, partial [Thermoanaerobaculia bacterium]|nr:ATP-binding protein [Thermoanaerobaculia bacterium]